jgi:hypothetical protein
MKMLRPTHEQNLVNVERLQFTTDDDVAGMPAWTEIDDGRFLPRRVRGSCQGRALG